MAEYIEREKVREVLTVFSNNYEDSKYVLKQVKRAISILPNADVKPVVHGRWIQNYETADGRQLRCSECGMVYWVGKGRDGNFCPNCGARMDGEGNDKAAVSG